MYRMYASFDLAGDASIDNFTRLLQEFVAHLQSLDLVASHTGPGRRHRHPVMDTDGARQHEYFCLLNFTSRVQCDAAVAHVQAGHEPAASLHRRTWALVREPVFSCWEDV